MWDFASNPGYYFVLATLLPLVSFLLILLASGAWCLAWRYRETPTGAQLYQLFGGDRPGPLPAYVATAAIALAFVCSAIGFVQYTSQHAHDEHEKEAMEQAIADKKAKIATAGGDQKKALQRELKDDEKKLHNYEKGWDKHGKGELFELIRLRKGTKEDLGTRITIGFKIDHLAGVMFCMVTFIATLIHLFSMGYMGDERQPTVEDHHVHAAHGHLHRRGRFGRFFMYLSLFCFSMLNLLLADNLFQVFVSWELVGICSYLLIGFYFERQTASNAANKAFITNRVGDAGFILGLLIVWAYFGTFHFETIFRQVRSPLQDSHGELRLGGKIVRATPTGAKQERPGDVELKVTMPGEPPGAHVVLFPRDQSGHFDGVGPRASEADDKDHPPELTVTAAARPDKDEFSTMPYWMLVAAGLGIFLGCVGKSAQFPLQVWLPDAMEGPTPVSALIHAATMVAAGVYLVGRCYPLFTAEVLLVIAYTGAITLFVAATIAIVMNDIKKVLAYSTVSQLGYMMLALGVGGWVAGLFHLVTHAFFKALLFLGSGSVIHGCHHEQDMMKMGGLYPKMKITAVTMFIGVLAIAGIPLFSGWYSKDAILAQAMGYVTVNRQHALLFILPLMTAGITTFYMFRMWFLTFTGTPRDEHVHEHAHESPWLMAVPLMVLAFFSIVVAWGGPPWDATASKLEHTVHHAQHPSVLADFGHVIEGDHKEKFPAVAAKPAHLSERNQAHRMHDQAGLLALGIVALGIVFAMATYYYRALDPKEAKEQFPKVHAFLANKWYFDEIYSALLVRPAMIVARAFQAVDLRGIDGVLHGAARGAVGVSRAHGRFDNGLVDGLVNLVGTVTARVGTALRGVQTGFLRSYVVFLVLGAVAVFVLMSYFVARAGAG